MRLIDTSAWIEWLLASEAGRQVNELLPTAEDWLVPTMVQFELAKWVTRELGEHRSDEVVAFSQTCRVEPLSTAIALHAADLSRTHKLAAADAIIYATALSRDADIVTCDQHFRDLPEVKLIRKGRPIGP